MQTVPTIIFCTGTVAVRLYVLNVNSQLPSSLIGTLGSISMAVAAGCVQAMQGSMPHFEVNGFRFILTLLSTIIYFLFKRQLPKVKRKEIIALGFFCSLVIGFKN